MVTQGLAFGMIVASALMIWKPCITIGYSDSPIVVVLSGSMEPSYYRGDILFLTNWDEPLEAGDIIVY